jgi:excisionase family DNA binding protein
MKRDINIEALERKARIAELASKLTWLRIPEAAAYANIGQSKLYDLVSDGTIKSSKDDGGLVVHRQAIDDYWNARQRVSNQSELSAPQLQSEAA